MDLAPTYTSDWGELTRLGFVAGNGSKSFPKTGLGDEVIFLYVEETVFRIDASKLRFYFYCNLIEREDLSLAF